MAGLRLDKPTRELPPSGRSIRSSAPRSNSSTANFTGPLPGTVNSQRDKGPAPSSSSSPNLHPPEIAIGQKPDETDVDGEDAISPTLDLRPSARASTHHGTVDPQPRSGSGSASSSISIPSLHGPYWPSRWLHQHENVARFGFTVALAVATITMLGAALNTWDGRNTSDSAQTATALWRSSKLAEADRLLSDAQRNTKQAAVPITDWVLVPFGEVSDSSIACRAHDDTLRAIFRDQLGPCVKLASVMDDWKPCVFHIDISISVLDDFTQCSHQMSIATQVAQERLEGAKENITREIEALSPPNLPQELWANFFMSTDPEQQAAKKMLRREALPNITSAELYVSVFSSIYAAAEDRANSARMGLVYIRKAVVSSVGEDVIFEPEDDGEPASEGNPRALWLEFLYLQLVASKFNETADDGQTYLHCYNALQVSRSRGA